MARPQPAAEFLPRCDEDAQATMLACVRGGRASLLRWWLIEQLAETSVEGASFVWRQIEVTLADRHPDYLKVEIAAVLAGDVQFCVVHCGPLGFVSVCASPCRAGLAACRGFAVAHFRWNTHSRRRVALTVSALYCLSRRYCLRASRHANVAIAAEPVLQDALGKEALTAWRLGGCAGCVALNQRDCGLEELGPAKDVGSYGT